MNRLTRAIALSFLLLGPFANVSPQAAPVTLRYGFGERYRYVERSNWSRYDNGKYTGLTHRETRASMACDGVSETGTDFSGTFFSLEETLRDMSASARGVDAAEETSFTVMPNGKIVFKKDGGYPRLREFPVFPERPIYPGDKWVGEGTRLIDPKNDGNLTALPIVVEYTLSGRETYKDKEVWRIKAKYATRLSPYARIKPLDANLASASGTHDADILIDAETCAVILILDRMNETFGYQDGSSVRFQGSTAIFTEEPVPFRGTDGANRLLAAALGDTAPLPNASTEPVISPGEDSQLDDASMPGGKPFIVENTSLGIRLSVRDIRFLADSAEIVPGEGARLDSIADALKSAPNGRFLVEGHTARVGKESGEKELSIERARRIVDELCARGLKSAQFMYLGHGGTKPIADNATEQGRAQNRRVEITILE
jgi:OmpA-OmpF porin, OOP family